METHQLYIDRIVPFKYSRIAREIAIAENPANASPFEGGAVTKKLWKPGRVLHIAFLDGEREVHKKVESYAKQWCNYANIHLIFDNAPDSEIRISFADDGSSWSAIGTDALVEQYFPKNQATMNFGWLRRDSSESDYSVVLHEFGHALGLIHEHQSPSCGILWNKPVVIGELSGPPNYWSVQEIEYNVFERYEVTQTQYTYTEFDPNSIMLYPIPKRWTLNGVEITPNKTLSITDKLFIGQCYP